MTLNTGWTVTQTKDAKGNTVDDRKVIMLRQDGQPANIQVQYVPYMINKGYRLVNAIMGKPVKNDKGETVWINPPKPGGGHFYTEFDFLTIGTPTGMVDFKPVINLEDISDVIAAELPVVSATSRADLKKAKEALKKTAVKKNKTAEIPKTEPITVEAPGEDGGKPKPRREPKVAASK